MGRSMIALLAAAIALVAASARAQSGQRVLAPTLLAAHDLPANAITTFALSCRPGFVATSAGIRKPAPGAALLSSTPVGHRTYRFRFGNPATNGKQRVTVAVACRKLAGLGHTRYKLKLTPLKPVTVTAPPGKAAGVSLGCPQGTVPAGAGADLDPVGQRSLQAYRVGFRVSLRRRTSTLRRFSFSVQNAGSQSRTAVLYGTCVTLGRARGAPRVRLHVEVRTVRAGVSAGNQTFRRRCQRGWFALAVGFDARSRLTRVDGAVAVGTGGRWTVSTDADTPAAVDLQLTCARLGS